MDAKEKNGTHAECQPADDSVGQIVSALARELLKAPDEVELFSPQVVGLGRDVLQHYD